MSKVDSKDHISEYDKFVIYHLLISIPFNLSHLFYINNINKALLEALMLNLGELLALFGES